MIPERPVAASRVPRDADAGDNPGAEKFGDVTVGSRPERLNIWTRVGPCRRPGQGGPRPARGAVACAVSNGLCAEVGHPEVGRSCDTSDGGDLVTSPGREVKHTARRPSGEKHCLQYEVCQTTEVVGPLTLGKSWAKPYQGHGHPHQAP